MTETPETIAAGSWFWVQTPNPAEMILAIVVSSQLMTPTNKPRVEQLAFGGAAYAAPTAFSALDPAFALPNLNHLGVADWQFIGESIGPVTTVFYFFAPKTAAEQKIPYYYNEVIGNHYWPMIVLEVWVESDYNFPISANVVEGNDTGIITGPTNYIRDIVIPDCEEGSLIITRKYLSATQPKREHRKIPHPMAMHVQVNGASKDYGKVLHGDIIIDAVRSGTKMYLTSAGASSDVGGATSQHIFEATNFTSRKPYKLLHEPVQNQYGLWETKEIEVRPPKTGQEAIER